MVHDFVDLERRVRELENAIRDGDARLKAAYTPTPFEGSDRDEYVDRLNKLYDKLVAKRAAMNLTRTTDTEVTVEAGSVKVKTKPSAWSAAAPGIRVNPGPATPAGVTEHVTTIPGRTTLSTVTWEDTVSGVKVTSVPCPDLRDARYSAQNLYIVALAEHLESFKSTYWFTVDDFVRLRKATNASHELCMRALHSTSTYERALAWLLNRDVKLKA